MALKEFVVQYNSLTLKSPLLVNACTGFIIASIGDLIAQKFFVSNKNTNKIDFLRSLKMGTIRALLITPFILKWYKFLAFLFPERSTIKILCRLFIDQLIGSPVVITLTFIGKALFQFEFFSLFQVWCSQFLNAWLAGLRFWPFVHFVNFTFVPIMHQPLFAHIASLYWTAILSFYSSQTDKLEKFQKV
jgi:hypothetical protein